MDKTKQQFIILGVLILLFIIIFVKVGIHPRKKPHRAPKAAPTETVAPKVEALKKRKASAFQNWGRDPFAVGSAAAEFARDLILTGILWEKGEPFCIINGKIGKVGDKVAGCKILGIEKDRVTVKVGDEIRILKIGGK
ncbi:MAG: hypothetical protein AMJ78_10375 [Omnitrophica WOR_2 bacterium SM23_29]|nr:MAG: hypothetical protein AMJ78_10375 [Omnitrophica WOR_2 bacterium SM23_29]